jgi:acetyl coenzyme A synthetase (ADP forming)-like protein
MTTAEAQPMTTYPAHLEADVVLRNGRTLHIRPVRPEDREKLTDFFRGLSPQSIHSRFFDMRTPEAAVQHSPVEVDYRRDLGLIGEIGNSIVAIAHYLSSRSRPNIAEASFTIADRLQGLGVGTRLLERLAEWARKNGIDTFEAEVLAENMPMVDVFINSGFEVTRKSDHGTIRVVLSLSPTEEFNERAADRSQKAAYASMKAIFEPKSIAVVGASRKRGGLGAEILRNLLTTGFEGTLYPINPRAASVNGVPAYARVSEVPAPIDLAIVAVPAADVELVVDDCIAKGVGAIVLITAGFAETGEAGRQAEKRLVDKIRAAGIRLVGPNCMGVINTDPSVRMHGTFTSTFPPAGNVAMSSQSGALGLAILDYAQSLNIGFSTFISVGNKADVSGNDLIQYWAEDPRTQVMVLYLESFGNPNKFGKLARRIGRKKPIVAVKAGRSESGARAARSHTGALATSDAIVGDLFRQAGIIRTDTLEELFDVASLLANQPLPPGRRVAVVTNAGGPGILAADACEAKGLTLSHLSESTMKQLRAFLPPASSVHNPIDMIASSSADDYRRALELVLKDEAVDAVLVLYIPVQATDAPGVAAAIREAAATAGPKPMVATFMSAHRVPDAMAPVPAFPFPERAVGALAHAVHYAEWRRRPVGIVQRFDDFDVVTARQIVSRAVRSESTWMSPADVRALLAAARISVVPTEFAADEEAAVAMAAHIGYPVALKVAGETLLHKSDVGGVRLGIADEDALREAYRDFVTRIGDQMCGVVVQQMISSGVEVMIGATDDPDFGHVLLYGAGGTLVELISDVAFRVHPLTDTDVADMLEEVRSTKLLRGFRGAPAADEAAVREALMRLSMLIDVCPEIRELDVNPLKVLTSGAIAVDARIRVAVSKPAPASRRIAY